MRKNLLSLLPAIAIAIASCSTDEPAVQTDQGQDQEDFIPDSSDSSSDYTAPGNIVDKHLHLFRSDGQKLVIEHLNNSAGQITNQEWISYIDGYAPSYTYNRKSSTTAQYNLMWTPSATPLIGGIRHFLDVILTFADSKNGSFKGTTWYEGWTTDGNPIRKQETDVSGTFYLGGSQAPEGSSGSSTDAPQVNKLEILSVTKTSDSSINVNCLIDVDGAYEEAGIFVNSYDHSIGVFGFSVPTNVADLKAKYPDRHKVKASSISQSIIVSGLKLSKYNIVAVYAIVGGKVHYTTAEFN